MEFRVIVSPRAQKEIETSIDFYLNRSVNAPKDFISSLEKAYETLSKNPFFALKHKNVRSLKLFRFPFSLYFVVHENEKLVQVLSCFHTSRNPRRRPKK
ncbi:MAG: type II toxin-antitoxin system RelE/ParE family toxin [Cytophagales bacterium]|nr:type II toxin-antitoxin system RelE/ParE family toxin [Cytophagales bacterium]